jgi:plasmid stability protein
MATLYVENVPDDLYDALRKQAKKDRQSISAEVISLLAQFVPTDAELKRRQRVLRQMRQLRRQRPLTAGPFPSTETMIREDRKR